MEGSEISENVAQQLKDTGKFWPCASDAAHHPQGMDLSSHQVALLIFSTQGDGVPPSEARQFCDWLAEGAAGALPHLAYSEDWSSVDAWIKGVIVTLETKLPDLKTVADLGGAAAAGLASSAAVANSSNYSKGRPYTARVAAVEGLCVLQAAEDKDTVRLQLSLSPEAAASGLVYEPGDALGIWPSNPPQLVDELLSVLGASGEEVVPTPSWHYVEDPRLVTSKSSSGSSSLRRALELLSDSVKMQAYLGPRHVADILQDFPSVTLSHDQFCPGNAAVEATIAVVRYSSLGKQRQGICSTQVAERLQEGQLLPVFISKNPDFRLPSSVSTPIIMVGPGTGLAPFRAFIQQRLLQHQQQSHELGAGPVLGAMHLFFGCRRRDQDFLYGQQLQKWHDDGVITLHTAFSRESDKKVYVQQRLRETAKEVWQLLQAGAHFYVCGDAGSMAGAVETALLDIITQHQQTCVPEGEANRQVTEVSVDPAAAAAAAAQSYLQQLVEEGRYQRDVWFS
eukprot:gene9416-9581_t